MNEALDASGMAGVGYSIAQTRAYIDGQYGW